MSAKRTERLLALVLLLTSTNRILTRSDIRAAILEYGDGSEDAFERKFERDKDELRSMGIPIDTVEEEFGSEGTGYRLGTDRAYLSPLELDAAEAVVLALAARTWGSAAWGNAAAFGLRKIETASDFDTPHVDTVVFSPNVETTAVASLLEATNKRQNVTFDYRKPTQSESEQRHVQPWGVLTEKGRWYLVGFDTNRNAVRVFRLSRIVGEVKCLKHEGAFEAHNEDDLRKYLHALDASDTVAAKVRLHPDHCHRLRTAASKSTGDIAEFVSIDEDWLVAEVLRAGSRAEVTEPEFVRARIRTTLETLVSQPRDVDAEVVNAFVQEAAQPDAPKSRGEDASVRLSRLLALVPWLQAHPGVTYDEAAAHFGVTKERLRKDLELAVCTEFGTQMLVLDIDIWDERIVVRDPQGIQAPMRLAPDEAMSLLVGLRLLSQVPGTHDREALARVQTKLEAIAGEVAEAVEHLDVSRVGGEGSESETAVRSAILDGLNRKRAIKLTYWSAARDVVSERIVDPISLFNTAGSSYLNAWCRSAEAIRMFRVDRIAKIQVLDEPANDDALADSAPNAGEIEFHGPSADFVLDPTIAWLADQIPVERAQVLPDGRVVIRIAMSAPEWAQGMVLAMAGAMRVLDPPDLAESVGEEAQSALKLYTG